MRLFYDISSTRARAEALLLGADAAAVSLAVLYATAAFHGGGSAWDIALVPLWASIPRAIARILGGLDRPRAGYRAALGVVALGILLAILLVLGHNLLASVSPPAVLREPFLLAVLYFAWGAGVLLAHPGAYRLHDVLLFSTLLLGLKESRPLPWIFVPLFLGAFFLSSAVRHILLDVFPGRRDPPLNLQNARAASLVAAAAVSAVFLVAALALGGASPPAPAPRPGPAIARPDAAGGAGGADRDAAGGGPFILEEAGDPRGTAGAPRVGFSYRVGLRELAFARLDEREVLRIAPDPGDPRARGWRPSGGTLWKGITLSTYDPGSESWIEESRLLRLGWPADDAVVLPGGASPARPGILLRAAVVLPVLKSAVQPYVTRRILSSEFTGYSLNALGDLFPHPPLARGTAYRLEVSPAGGPAAGGAGGEADPRYLEVPSAAAAGVDLASMARSIFRGGGSAGARIEALRAHFERGGFRYSNRASWRGKEPIARFLEEEKVGSCAYFATAAALLLRAGGVHARLAAGFLGGEWDAGRGEAVIRNRDAHAWVEALVPGAGWRPVDPTGWVPADPSWRPPPEVEPSLGGGLDGGAGRQDPGPADTTLEAMVDTGMSPAAEPGGDFAPGSNRSGITLSSAREGEPLPAGLEEATALESWLEYREEAGVEPLDLAGGSPAPDGADPGRPDLPGGVRVHPPAALRAPAPFGTLPREEGLGPGLRAALILLGGAVLALLVYTFIRPRRKTEEDEEGAEDVADATGEGGAAAPSSGIFLDEADPRDRVLADYLRLQASLERTRSHRRPHWTPLEHGRLAARGRKGLEAAFRELHAVLYRLVYGGEEIEERHAEAVRRSCRRIRRYLG